LNTTGSTGFPATIIEYEFENTGASVITGGTLPEPSTMALLGLMAAGAAGVRGWRKLKANLSEQISTLGASEAE
jgi:hypothetical protein